MYPRNLKRQEHPIRALPQGGKGEQLCIVDPVPGISMFSLNESGQ